MTLRPITTACILFLFTLAAQPLAAQHAREAPRPIRYAAAIDSSRAMIGDLMRRTGIPGITVAISKEGLLLWSEGFGYADVENRVAVWPHTKMRVGSVAKSMTAAAMGILIDQGMLNLDAPVQQYVPYFPEKRHPITPRQVAGHLPVFATTAAMSSCYATDMHPSVTASLFSPKIPFFTSRARRTSIPRTASIS